MAFARIQSPSSINTYKQCPRKYYYHYIKELESRPSIHLVRGKIAHSVLEDFFKLDIGNISNDNYDFEFKIILHELLSKHWKGSERELGKLGLTDQEIRFYLDETTQMIQFWLLDFLRKLRCEMQDKSLAAAFSEIAPETELYLCSEEHGVQGYIDAVYENNGCVKIIDYKTSARAHMSDSYRLQLAIYSMLYYEKYKKLPKEAGIHFLRFNEKTIPVNENLIEHARRECELIHVNTQSKDINDYPRITSPLCKWSTGQCDFFIECNKEKN